MLSEEDHDNIRAFHLFVKQNWSREAFDDFRRIFRHHISIDSPYRLLKRVSSLSNVIPQPVDCCINVCMAYTGTYSELSQCIVCKEPRYNNISANSKQVFLYLPLIPRLQGLFQDPKQTELMEYRSEYDQTRTDGSISDVFDGQRYQSLCSKRVVVDGIEFPHRYFSGEHDIALGFATDSYLMFMRRRKAPCSTPLLLVNYNIGPDIRIHREQLISLGNIPGPKAPVLLATFLHPLDDELAQLAIGVPTFHAVKKCLFDLRAYNLFGLGDIIAIEKLLNIKGHNEFSPCRECKILGTRNISGEGKVYYTPLTPPKDSSSDMLRTWDPQALPHREHGDFQDAFDQIEAAARKVRKKKVAFETGIKGLPAIGRRVLSMDYSRCFPWEWCHLFAENIILGLVDL
jgi:hypothetical protein